MRCFTILGSAIGVMSTVGGIIAGVCIFVGAVIIAYSVIMRYIFNRPPLFVDEVAGYLLIAIVFLGLAYALKVGAHISISVVTSRLSERAQNLLDAITLTVGLVYVVWFSIMAFDLWLFNWELKTFALKPMRTPLWIPQIAFIVGFPLLALQLIMVIIQRLKAFSRVSK